jgi:hypothetical protein
MPGAGAGIRRDALPQCRLPSLSGRDVGTQIERAAVRPDFEPRRPVDDVLVEERSDSRREVEPVAGVAVSQIARQRRLRGDERRVAEQRIDPPRQDIGGERRVLADRHDARDLPPQPLREEGKARVGADAETRGGGEFDVAADRGAGDDHLVGDEGSAAGAASRSSSACCRTS